jgi:hypothetical protein
MDQAMIHVASVFFSYATSANVPYVLFNGAFNLICARRHFFAQVQPRKNQGLILLSTILYTVPLAITHVSAFLHVWAIFAVGGWLFCAYPVQGWSHALFHLVLAAMPPLLLQVAIERQGQSVW